MRNYISIAALAFLAFSCGEAGVGFNIGKEFPVSIPVDLPNGTPELIGTIPGDPPPVKRSEEYSLAGAGYNDLDALDAVVVNGLSFEITGVDASEQFELDAIEIDLIAQSGSVIAQISVTTPQLSNVTKTSIADAAGLAALESALANQEDITADVSFDFGEVPNEDVNFEFVLYFDVVAKVRDL